MKTRVSGQNAPGDGAAHQAVPGEAANQVVRGEAADQALRGGAALQAAPNGAASQADPKTDLAPSVSTPQPTERSTGSEKSVASGRGTFQNDVEKLDEDLQDLVSKMLTEGSTFEDVVEAVNERGGQCLTLNAVQNYFQGNLQLQAKRVRHMVNSADALLATAGKNPKSAEARLARATFLTGYLRVRRDASQISPRDAEHARIVRENVSLRRRILAVQKEKVLQELKYSNARIRMILLSQEKLKEEILKLQQEAKGHRAGEPLGPEMLQRIHQLYGLACQPLLCEENADGAAKA
jgi:hypothetical protein